MGKDVFVITALHGGALPDGGKIGAFWQHIRSLRLLCAPPNALAPVVDAQDPAFWGLRGVAMIGPCLSRLHDAQAISPILGPTGFNR